MADVQLFKLKPLNWVCHRPADHPEGEYWTADSVFNTLAVEHCIGDGYHFRFCVDEYYDEGDERHGSIAECKERAEEWYLKRLLPALVMID